jgi:aminopeptidase N
VPSVRRCAAALSLLLLAGAAAAPALGPAAAVDTPTAGAHGIGDAYFPKDGNGGYDVTHYDIHDTYRLRSGYLTGRTTVRATATQDLSSLSLDLMLTPEAVRVNGKPATYAKDGRHELTVTPATPVDAGAAMVIEVRYHGTPRRLGWGGEQPFLSAPGEAVAMNEPHIAPWWFPVNDHPQDKAPYDITVAVARGHQVVSNGTLVGRRSAGAWTSWHWRESSPMASYLAFFAAGRFRIASGTTYGLPWTVAVSKVLDRADQEQQIRLLRKSPGIVHWLETQFGPYPFESTGGVVTSLPTGFALENQSRPTYPFLGAGHQAHSVVVHELAHQWFGDQVSVRRWRDIWLNEGFATWTEWRFDEAHGGPSAWRRMQREYASHPATDGFWRLRIGDPGPARMFDQPVYDRGGMALEALRHRIGTTRFLTVLRTWVEQHPDAAHGTGTVEEFEALAEHVSDQDLGAFFTSWLRTGARPAHTAANGLV